MRARAINLTAELNELPGLKGRTPQTPESALEGRAFGATYPYRDGYISTVKYSGTSAWERHEGEEILLVAEGQGFLHIIDDDGFDVPRTLSTNLLIIVPAGVWHQIESHDGISLVTVSPQPTKHQAERP
jgi:mannose-6-phosphate isomerase-like protein (cupin superfamily)